MKKMLQLIVCLQISHKKRGEQNTILCILKVAKSLNVFSILFKTTLQKKAQNHEKKWWALM